MRILIADDHPFVRRGVTQVLTEEFPGVVIGEASSVPELLAQAGRQAWDIVVLDLTMPGRGGLDALHELKAITPEVRVLVLSMHPEDQFAVRVIRAGAAGYLTKESIPAELVQAVKKISAGAIAAWNGRRSPACAMSSSIPTHPWISTSCGMSSPPRSRRWRRRSAS